MINGASHKEVDESQLNNHLDTIGGHSGFDSQGDTEVEPKRETSLLRYEFSFRLFPP